jgi:Ala-tRNA(Pro) deacylase
MDLASTYAPQTAKHTSEARSMPDPIDIVTDYLDRKAVGYEVVEHAERFTAAAEARAAGVEPTDAAKEVVLQVGDAYVVAVIPASEQLDLAKVRTALDAEDRPRLATEAEIGERFPEFEVGALPPLGPIHDASAVVDRRLLEHDRVLCAGGDHRHSLRVDPNDIVQHADARVADICRD